jgi:carboxypeptidase T
MADQQPRRFFVTVVVLDAQRLPTLRDMNLDLFGPRPGETRERTADAAPRSVEPAYEIDGRMTLGDVGRLVEAGFVVIVRGTDEPTRKPEGMEAEEWLDGMREYVQRGEMAPSRYLTTIGIEGVLLLLSFAYPGFTELVPFGTSEEGKPIRALRIRSGAGERNGALLIGGTHAREVLNPDLLCGLAFKLCWAYDNDTGLTFGDKRWSKTDVRALVDGMDVFIVPNINPDGRDFALNFDPWWRKNRGVNADGTIGADLARNCDFLWRWKLGASSVSTDLTYAGDEVWSERESRNVRDFLAGHAQVTCFIDVHSYAEAILHPWGDDEHQTTDESMSFRNVAWDGLRGNTADAYKEFIPAVDEAKYKARATSIREAIRAVRGRRYRVVQAGLFYPFSRLSGTPMDYAYSRFFTGPRSKVWAFTVESNRGPIMYSDEDPLYGFKPPFPEALRVMEEVQSGLIQFLLSCVCVVREVGKSRLPHDALDHLRDFRDAEMSQGRRGRRIIDLLDTHGDELLSLLAADARARESAEVLVVEGAELVFGRERDEPPTVTRQLAARIDRLVSLLEKKASPELRKALATARKDAQAVIGKTARQAIR